MGLCLQGPRFPEHSNRSIDIERLIPPENIYHEIHGRICKRHDFEMGDRKVFSGPCYALQYEPRRLKQDEGFSEPVALSLVLDFRLGRNDERFGVNITLLKILLLQRMEGLIIFPQYASIVVTRFFGAAYALKEMKSSHYD